MQSLCQLSIDAEKFGLESFEINSSQIDLNISLLIPLKMYPWKACLKKKIGKHNISIQSVRIDQKQDKCVVHFLSSGISLLLSTILFFPFTMLLPIFMNLFSWVEPVTTGKGKKWRPKLLQP